MATTTAAAPVADRGDRIAFAVIAGMTALLGIAVLIDGVWRTIALATDVGPVDLIAQAEVAGNVGNVSVATVRSDAIDEPSRALLVIASALALVVATSVYAAIVVFLVMTARGTPFHRLLYPVVLLTGILMSIGGILAGGLDGLGRMMAGGGLGEPYQAAFELTIGPWAFGFVVLVAAYVIRVGQRLQRDSEGLV